MKLLNNGPDPSEYRYDRQLDDGLHCGTVLKASETVSRAGNDMIVITFGIEGHEGPVRVDHYVVTRLAGHVSEMLGSLAPEHLHDWELGSCDFDLENLIGRTCWLQVHNEEWQGKLCPSVTRLLTNVPLSRRHDLEGPSATTAGDRLRVDAGPACGSARDNSPKPL